VGFFGIPRRERYIENEDVTCYTLKVVGIFCRETYKNDKKTRFCCKTNGRKTSWNGEEDVPQHSISDNTAA